MSRSGEEVVEKDINVLALVKGEERYIFLFDDGEPSPPIVYTPSRITIVPEE